MSKIDLLQNVLLKSTPCDYQDYLKYCTKERAESLGISQLSSWKIHQSVVNKIDINGSYKNFFGDTLVYKLPGKIIETISTNMAIHLEDIDFLSDLIPPLTYHITLHDLSNGVDQDALKPCMEQNQLKVDEIFRKIRNYLIENPDQNEVTLIAQELFSSKNIAIAIEFIPKTDRDYKILLNLYNLFEEVVGLNYKPQFHATLAYFKPCAPDREKLSQLIFSLNKKLDQIPQVKLTVADLIYQHFTSMAQYQDILKL